MEEPGQVGALSFDHNFQASDKIAQPSNTVHCSIHLDQRQRGAEGFFDTADSSRVLNQPHIPLAHVQSIK